MRRQLTSVGITFLFITEAVSGFELGTHAVITDAAMHRFLTRQPTKLQQLGLDHKISEPRNGNAFGRFYIDISENEFRYRLDSFKERAIIKSVGETDWLSLVGWTMAGAIREDDWFGSGGSDANATEVRPLRHFYDPAFNRGLHIATGSFDSSISWATGAADPIFRPNIVDKSRANHFTFQDAKEALFRAITLMKRQFGIWTGSTGDTDPTQMDTQRRAYWATTFRALGDVVHLLQDAAQPQHTRNDAHGGIPSTGHASTFELYLEARAMQKSSFAVSWPTYAAAAVVRKDLPFQICRLNTGCVDYPTVTGFSQYSHFWTTQPGAPKAGRGLADFSNTNFFSAGTNLGHNDYQSPPNYPGVYGTRAVPVTKWDGTPAVTIFGNNLGSVYLYDFTVVDNLNPGFSASGVPLTTASVFDEFLRRTSLRETFHLSRENYDAQANLLIPRAVAYSAGLLEFFFRGAMEIRPPSSGIYAVVDHSTFGGTDAQTGFKGFGKIKLKLRNTTPNAPGTTTPEPMSQGTLFAVLKFHRNTCYVDSLDGEITRPEQAPVCRSPIEEVVVSDPINNTSVQTASSTAPDGPELTFSFPKQLPINAWDVVLQVVYRGRLGNEDDAVVVATRDISEPTFITIVNDTDYVALGTSCYKPEVIAASDTLWNSLAPVCRAAGATRSVAPSCVNVPFNMRLSTGEAAAPLALTWGRFPSGDTSIAPRRFGRFAYLEDTTPNRTWRLSLPNEPYVLSTDTFPDLAYQLQFDPEVHRSDYFVTQRGLHSWTMVGVVIDGMSGKPGVGCGATKLDALAGAERTPLTAAITGW